MCLAKKCRYKFNLEIVILTTFYVYETQSKW
jgi:hypothetical protein